jgi:hypothetical protein
VRVEHGFYTRSRQSFVHEQRGIACFAPMPSVGVVLLVRSRRFSAPGARWAPLEAAQTSAASGCPGHASADRTGGKAVRSNQPASHAAGQASPAAPPVHTCSRMRPRRRIGMPIKCAPACRVHLAAAAGTGGLLGCLGALVHLPTKQPAHLATALRRSRRATLRTIGRHAAPRLVGVRWLAARGAPAARRRLGGAGSSPRQSAACAAWPPHLSHGGRPAWPTRHQSGPGPPPVLTVVRVLAPGQRRSQVPARFTRSC